MLPCRPDRLCCPPNPPTHQAHISAVWTCTSRLSCTHPITSPRATSFRCPVNAEFAEKRKTYSFFLLSEDLAVANSSGGPKTLMYRVK